MSVKLCAAVKADNRKLQRQADEDGKRGVKIIEKRVDHSAAPQLRFVERDDKCIGGGFVGTITTNPRQIAGVVTRAWMKIYKGNVANCMAAVANFISVYWKYVFRSPPQEVEQVHVAMVWANFQAIEDSVVGMDGCEPMELKLFSCELCVRGLRSCCN